MLNWKDYRKGYINFKVLMYAIIIAIIIIAIYLTFPVLNKNVTLNQENKIPQQQLSEASIALSNEIETVSQISLFNFKSDLPIHLIKIEDENIDGITKYYLNINSQRYGPFKYALFYISTEHQNLSIELIDFDDFDLNEKITINLVNWDMFKKTDQFTDRYGHRIGFSTIYYTK